MVRVCLEHQSNRQHAPIKDEPDEALRSARLVGRIFLNQGNGTFEITNIIADDLAEMIVLTLRREGLLPKEEA
ncbi:hypothetical protein SEA_HORTUS1_75 [Microbacterium phage Hortus1]|nr:hypothetical protein SEA_HORTUS1_75 [Microbacterium phage Hortus1]AWY05645.1 hypothetical protein SEA_OLINDD_75 [Microbacterium phage OlinDD]AWY05898.1 hypothetical protein SEA_PIONEER3_75 [Microbacterium phage Pioneer3]AWY06404.1 hypothetical protein SEA_TANDEM_75 [Microbacterium phage Tandem]